ncbi:MAG: poly(3-hydroxybutyrate) depolymerase [Pseudomonadota bacterium]
MRVLSSTPAAAHLALAIAIAAVTALTAHADTKPATPYAPVELPKLAADTNQTTVSGISSGAYMAGQFQMAHGQKVIGAAIIAGGPYGCAVSAFSGVFGASAAFNLQKAINGCMLNALAAFGIPNPRVLARRARRMSGNGEIAPLDALQSHRIYLFAGTEDVIVRPAIVRAALRFYRVLGVPDRNIRFDSGIAAGHGFVTEKEGAACATNRQPFVVDCDYDQAGELLRHLYGRLEAAGAASNGRYVAFKQRPFTTGVATHGLADVGVAYVPAACEAGDGCRVHIAFHGCDQARRLIGDRFVKRTGFARWAATNRLIILFPQVRPTAFNPQACWDWWGYTGRKFLTRAAPQIRAVRRMLDRLGARDG